MGLSAVETRQKSLVKGQRPGRGVGEESPEADPRGGRPYLTPQTKAESPQVADLRATCDSTALTESGGAICDLVAAGDSLHKTLIRV